MFILNPCSLPFTFAPVHHFNITHNYISYLFVLNSICASLENLLLWFNMVTILSLNVYGKTTITTPTTMKKHSRLDSILSILFQLFNALIALHRFSLFYTHTHAHTRSLSLKVLGDIAILNAITSRRYFTKSHIFIWNLTSIGWVWWYCCNNKPGHT